MTLYSFNTYMKVKCNLFILKAFGQIFQNYDFPSSERKVIPYLFFDMIIKCSHNIKFQDKFSNYILKLILIHPLLPSELFHRTRSQFQII
jgi:hypothetical protein